MRQVKSRIVLAVILAGGGLVPSRAEEPRARTEQREFTTATPLLDPQGSLSAWGWARGAVMRYNREAIPRRRLGRIKEWEHYTITSPQFTVGVTIVQMGGLVMASAELLDYADQSNKNAMFLRTSPADRSLLPTDPYGATRLERNDDFVALSYADKRRVMECRFRPAGMSPAFAGRIEMDSDPAEDSVAITRPFAGEGEFFYENKIFGMPARGTVTVDGRSYSLPPGNSWAIFDWGRGIWPHESQWFWGQAAGLLDGQRVAINLGHGYGDDARGTCNAILYEGKLHKLDIVDCQFNPDDRLQPWRFTSNDGRLTLDFRPIYQQHTKQDLVLARAELFKIHGYYTGELVLDDGRRLAVRDLLGFAEHMQQRW